MQVPPLDGGMAKNPLPLINGQVPSSGLKFSEKKKKNIENGSSKDMKGKADPFAVPDNDYSDSFLDSLWINLLSSRLAVAVEAEEAFTTSANGRVLGQGERAAAAAAADQGGDLIGSGGIGGGGGGRVSDSASTATSGSPSVLAGAISDSATELPRTESQQRPTGEALLLRQAGRPPVVVEETAAARGEEENGRGDLALTKPATSTAAAAGAGVSPTAPTMVARRTPGGNGGGLGWGGGMGGGYTYEDYVALATRLQAGAPERQREVVRGVLRSVFPGWFPAFYRMLFPPSKV